MIYILCIITGTLLTTLAVIGTYEFVDYDLYIVLWLAIYTIGIYTMMYGVQKTRSSK